MEKIVYIRERDLCDINFILNSGEWTVKSISPIASINGTTGLVGSFGAYVVIESKED